MIHADLHLFIVFYILAFFLAWVVLVYEGWRGKRQLAPWLVFIAWSIFWGIVGARLGKIPLVSWFEAFRSGAIPTTSGKTFLGLVLFGAGGVIIARRWLRLPVAVIDSFALALPIGLLIARFGCLFGGCCFGKTTDLPWSITYSPGSPAYNLHLKQNLISANAPSSLGVHPVQLYEIILLILVIVVLMIVRPHLKRGGLFLLYLCLHAFVRFVIEFFRAGPSGGLPFGLRPVQVVLFIIAVGAGIGLFLLKRQSRYQVTVNPGTTSNLRLLVATGIMVILFVVFYNWFTPLEQTVLVFTIIPAGFAVGASLLQAGCSVKTRWATLAIIGGAVIFLGVKSDSLPGKEIVHISYFNIDGAVAAGQYQEICGPVYDYQALGLGASQTHRWGRFDKLEYGLQVFYDRDKSDRSGAVTYLGGRAFVKGDTRWAGLGIGGFASYSKSLYPDYYQILPLAHVRLGPSDIFWIEGQLLDEPAGRMPFMKLGLGFVPVRWLPVRAGISFWSGFYLNPDLISNNGFVLSPFVAYGDRSDWHIGLKLRYSFPTKN